MNFSLQTCRQDFFHDAKLGKKHPTNFLKVNVYGVVDKRRGMIDFL